MIWQAHKLTLQLTSPLHIGYHRVGNLQRTRRYVTGRVVWGALTAHLTRLQAERGDGTCAFTDYEETGKQVNDSIKFSYFYPTINPDKPLYPRFDKKQQTIVFGKDGMKQETFEHLLLSSYASTALNADLSSAEEGSLHEIECLVPWVRDNEDPKPVYLIGYLFLKAESAYAKNDDIKSIIDRLQFGGERSYGFGQVQLNTWEPDPLKNEDFFGQYAVNLDTPDAPLIKIPPNRETYVLFAHTLTDGLGPVQGDVEPLVWRAWDNTTEHYELTEAQLCWAPGSILNRPDGIQGFKIGHNGLWKGEPLEERKAV